MSNPAYPDDCPAPDFDPVAVEAKAKEYIDLANRCAGVTPTPPVWAVSVVLTQHKPDGKLNVQNHLQKVHAKTREEAIGKAVENSIKHLPKHQIHCYTAMEFN